MNVPGTHAPLECSILKGKAMAFIPGEKLSFNSDRLFGMSAVHAGISMHRECLHVYILAYKN